MYQVIQTTGTDEPWWMFDNWKEMIVASDSFETLADAIRFFEQQKEVLEKRYSNQKEKKGAIAFWNDQETEYCIPCEEDLQIYHGLFVMNEQGQLVEMGGSHG